MAQAVRTSHRREWALVEIASTALNDNSQPLRVFHWAVLAPMFAAPLLALVSHYPAGDWRIGAPFYFCAALQLASLSLAILHFRRHRNSLKASGDD